jgi:predicted Fe-S protein YdhL (DUF1289 family)
MGAVKLEIPESQVVDWAQQVSAEAKRAILRALIPRLDEFEGLIDYGNQRIQALCAERGIDWDSLSESEREHLIDDLLHETERQV